MKLRILLATGLGLLVSTQSFASLDATSLIETIPFSGTVTSVCKFSQDYINPLYGASAATVLDDGKGGILAQSGQQVALMLVVCNDPLGFTLTSSSLNGSKLIGPSASSIPYTFSMSPQGGIPSNLISTIPANFVVPNSAGAYAALVTTAAASGQLVSTFLPNAYANNMIGADISIAASNVSIAGVFSDSIKVVLSPK